MCGIVGKLYYDPGHPVESRSLSRMCRALVHRGPDDEGAYCNGSIGLAARRLAVIDIAGGRQPLCNETGSVWAVCNGEIYDFASLRAGLEQRGHRFAAGSDAEVIVHLYEEHGVDFPTRIEGMFAIALWDTRRRRLVLVRDRMGIKPLYYAPLADRLVFGSELKALLADDLPTSVDLQALSHYLSLLYIPAPWTIYREARQLEPAQRLVWQDGKLSITSYWRLSEPSPNGRMSPREAQEQLVDILRRAVRRQLVADVPVGCFLSGGMDSTLVTALAAQEHAGRLQTFSVAFDDRSYDETPYALLASRHLGTEHHLVQARVTPDLVRTVVCHFDEPFADSSALPLYTLASLAARSVTVALGGDGGDELFAGYLTYQADKLAQLYGRLPGALSRRIIPALVRRLPVSDDKVSLDLRARRFVASALEEPGRRHYAWKAFFSAEAKASLLAPDVLARLDGDLDSYPVFARHYDAMPGCDDLSRCQYTDMRVYLPDNNLTKVDRMTMAHSLEVRVPLLDEKVVDLAFHLPSGARMKGLRLKHMLREAARGLVPAPILARPKKGFNVPMSRWLKRELRPLLFEYLNATKVQCQGYFRPEETDRLVRQHLAGVADHSRNLWALLVWSLWVEHAAAHRPAPAAVDQACMPGAQVWPRKVVSIP